MNRYTLHKAGINVSEGMQRLKLDKATYENLLIAMIDDQNFNRLCQAIDEKDVSSAFLYGHSLKGIAANLSLSKLYSEIAPVVEILKQNSFEDVETFMPRVKQAYELVIDVLQEEIRKALI